MQLFNSRTVIDGLVILVVILVIGVSLTQHASALRQVAGKVELVMTPGETQSFRWGLISDIDEQAELGVRAEGAGSEFLAFPKTVDLGPKQSVYVSVNVTIPAEHPGNVTLKPIVYATQFGQPGGPTVINLQMQKTLAIMIVANPDIRFKTLDVKTFEQQVKIGESDIQLSIQSSSEVSEFALEEQERRVSFRVSGMSGTNGSALVPISRVLEGPYSVMIDGMPTTDFGEIRNDTSAETSVRINYSHSVHAITITGTNVVPEFPLPILALGAFVIAIVTVLRSTKSLRNWVQG
jgi:hypothetical protein